MRYLEREILPDFPGAEVTKEVGLPLIMSPEDRGKMNLERTISLPEDRGMIYTGATFNTPGCYKVDPEAWVIPTAQDVNHAYLHACKKDDTPLLCFQIEGDKIGDITYMALDDYVKQTVDFGDKENPIFQKAMKSDDVRNWIKLAFDLFRPRE